MFTKLKTHTHSLIYTPPHPPVSHLHANMQHERLTPDFASSHIADGSAYTGWPVVDHLPVALGLLLRLQSCVCHSVSAI
jgi:hypothetical protein